MFCINCGKEISGNIPICGECLQGVLDRHRAEQEVLTRVNLEAQPFSIKKVEKKTIVEEPPTVPEPETLSEEPKEVHEEDATNTQNAPEDDSKDGWITFAIVMAVVLFLFILCIL